jgi:hypothetical protein
MTMAKNGRRYSLRLEPSERLLYQAVVHADQESLNEWLALLNMDTISHSEFRLLGLLHHQHSQALPEQVAAICSGIYQRNWYLAQRQIVCLNELQALIAEPSQRLLILKGISLASLYYPSLGSRCAGDIDIYPVGISPFHLAQRLKETGFTNRWPYQSAWWNSLSTADAGTMHSLDLQRDDTDYVDLHFYLDARSLCSQLDSNTALRCIDFEVNGISYKTLSATDSLIKALAQSRDIQSSSGLQDAVDIALILREASSRIDWDLFVTEVRTRQISSFVKSALHWMQGIDTLTIPPEVLRDIAAIKRCTAERLYFNSQATWSDSTKNIAHQTGREGLLPRAFCLKLLCYKWQLRCIKQINLYSPLTMLQFVRHQSGANNLATAFLELARRVTKKGIRLLREQKSYSNTCGTSNPKCSG